MRTHIHTHTHSSRYVRAPNTHCARILKQPHVHMSQVLNTRRQVHGFSNESYIFSTYSHTMNLHLYVHIQMYVRIYTRVYVYIYIYMYVYVYVFMCMCICWCIQINRESKEERVDALRRESRCIKQRALHIYVCVYILMHTHLIERAKEQE